LQNNNVPLISVILPAYNAEKYIEAAVTSILLQTFRDFELIIIDDGSNDKTYEIVKNLANKDKRVYVLSRENRGLVSSLNEGIDLANAPLIARMDADDIALPERLYEQVNFLNNHSDIVCVGTAQIIIDEDGDELTCLSVPSENSVIQEKLLQGHCPLEHPSVMFRTEAVRALGAYRKDCEAAEDYDLWLRLGEIGKLANINKPLIKYRYLSSSISAANQSKQRESTKKACIEAWERRGVTGEFQATSEWRASHTRSSKLSFALKFGWWAYNYKNRNAAIKYAKRAISLAPWCLEVWKLFFLSFFNLKHFDS
jgi:glycosyltransferase involved in cell wall biosynthesis